MSARALALWCVLVVAVSARAAAYTVDCNHEYTDCDTELSKITGEEDDVRKPPVRKITSEEPKLLTTSSTTSTTTTTSTTETTTTEHRTETETEAEAEAETDPETDPTPLSEVGESIMPPQEGAKTRARLLNLNVDELQNFAIALHNETNAKGHKKHLSDLSDVNLDVDDDDEPRMIPIDQKQKDIPEKFYTNLQAPFHPLMTAERGSEEMDTCKENEITYKIGERMDRGCEETCECIAGGIFDCSPRCKHPYIRRGRRLNDPLCFESPVDECCSIIACATDNSQKVVKPEVCRYGNDTHPVGSQWNIGCEQTCICEPNSIVTCKPRCNPLPVSDKCINVQDPNDACCEVQVCDVSHDVHEEPENTTTSTTSTTEVEVTIKGFEDYEEQLEHIQTRPLVLAEPIGSVKVLQNNSVQVNLMHLNESEDPIHLLLSNDGGKSFSDVELKYSNLILNLEGGKDYILKTKETGTKFNFTITASDNGGANEGPTHVPEVPSEVPNEVPNEDIRDNVSKIGCVHEGQFYEIGDEFHIGCTELCECVGPDQHECAALVCPSHVGLELVSKGCVRWAPSPPATPPNCCPRSARCLSDGTCHYKGVAVPNWSEVPISLTGCEQRCFCENGDLDCQDVCSPLPAVPPQTLRCPPGHRPAAVNISDEDCCKQWGCAAHAAGNGSSFQSYSMPVLGEIMNYVTPVASDVPTSAPVIPTPPLTTDSVDFYRHLSPVKSLPKYLKTVFPVTPITVVQQYAADAPTIATPPNLPTQGDNITVFTLDDIDAPFKTIHPEPPSGRSRDNWELQRRKPDASKIGDPFRQPHSYNTPPLTHPDRHINIINTDSKIHDYYHRPPAPSQRPSTQSMEPQKVNVKSIYEPVRKVPISKIENLNYFLPSLDRRPMSESFVKPIDTKAKGIPEFPNKMHNLFEPIIPNTTTVDHHVPRVILPQSSPREQSPFRKHVTILKTKDMKSPKPTEMYHDVLWQDDTKAHHVLTKEPNPYETVLLRPVLNSKPDIASTYTQNTKSTHMSGKSYTALDLEHLLNQMEVESVVNKNLGRSADKNPDDAAGVMTTDGPHQQSFLPTIPPDTHYPPDESIPDYDQNNIHRPISPAEPALHGLPPGLTLPPGYGDLNKKLTVISMQADSPTSVKMLFGLPPVLVGLRGSVDLRYTDKADEDITNWFSQVFAPADEVLTTPRLEFTLTGLTPGTTYKIRGKLYLHNLPVEPESEIYTVRTLDSPTTPTVEEKRREIDSRLTVVDVNDTTAHVSWRRFLDDELQFIDAIQVRYRPVGTPIYSMTELLHHSRSTAELIDLRPGSRYEASLVLVPPPKATTELTDPGKVEFTTAPYVDPYNWTVTISARSVGSGAAEVSWRGVPAPAERWARVFRAAHACGGAREHDAFSLAARDLSPVLMLTGLQPNSKCRIWLEIFLTNGKVKTSNVLEITTKSEDAPETVDNEVEASSVAGRHRGDYYGALVGVGAVAALGALTSLLLLLVVLRRHRPRSVPITTVPSAPRESSLPPYDNPAYKLELQQETMDL
ncbi:hypothetical protein B5X24_HaOG204322 [Helicoverpa armigera]|uniref:Fibronectin type-III domain-containing protein n=1 Tax=Helicoverpa armigera TaxID=29058 RepID=A0A2W1BQU2_HELAM|nr:hypothetical protein B5X24_HaOG204322 [Helicoverpa armigera]